MDYTKESIKKFVKDYEEFSRKVLSCVRAILSCRVAYDIEQTRIDMCGVWYVNSVNENEDDCLRVFTIHRDDIGAIKWVPTEVPVGMLGVSKEEFEIYCQRLRKESEDSKRKQEQGKEREENLSGARSFLLQYQKLIDTKDAETLKIVEDGMRKIQQGEAI